MKSVIISSLLLGLTLVHCKRAETFKDIGNTFASPVDVAVSDAATDAGSHFFVLNADFDRTYNQGSIIIMDKDGNKVGRVLVPRMGRNLTVAGNDMLVTFDSRDDGELPFAQLYDVSAPATPVLKASWDLPCSPFGTTMRKDYDNFVISCMGGQLFIGTLAADRSQSTLKRVRDYATPRRALYIDTKRDLLFGFTSDPSQKEYADAELRDVRSWNDNAEEQFGADGAQIPNEVPDDMEGSKRKQSDKGRRHMFQFFVYDMKAERAPTDCVVTAEENCLFPFRSDADPIVQKELRWIYFKLQNFDGTPDGSAGAQDATIKYYRTNFWEAQPDPVDADVFYLSHRGRPDKSPHSNQIVRVTLIDDPRAFLPTERFMTFDRVYGFKGEGVGSDGVDYFKFHFPGDFQVREVQGQKLLVLNHFRDLANWVKADHYFSIAAQVIDDLTWFAEIRGNLNKGDVTTYFQVAINQDGVAASCSFYGNAVMLLQITPGADIAVTKRVE